MPTAVYDVGVYDVDSYGGTRVYGDGTYGEGAYGGGSAAVPLQVSTAQSSATLVFTSGTGRTYGDGTYGDGTYGVDVTGRTYGDGIYGSGTYSGYGGVVVPLQVSTAQSSATLVLGPPTIPIGPSAGYSGSTLVLTSGAVIPAVQTSISIREGPPLRVHTVITTPSGKTYRWADDEPDAANIPTGLRFSDTMPGGFETMDCSLPRKSGIDYSDLERLSTITVYGAGGDIAGEYRLERVPRVSGSQMSVGPSAVGWQAHLEDDKSASMVYIDRSLSNWTGSSVSRALAIAAASWNYSEPTIGNPDFAAPSLLLGLDGAWNRLTVCEAQYVAPAGVNLATFVANWEANANISTADANWSANVFTMDPSGPTYPEFSSDYMTAATGTVTFQPTAPLRGLMLQLRYAVAAGLDSVNYDLNLTNVVVGGDHGEPLSNVPDWGIKAPDVVAHAVGTWAPLLNFVRPVDYTTGLNIPNATISDAGFLVPHLTFPESTTAGEIVRQATRFGLEDWAVWQGKTFWWHPRGAYGKRWRARIGPTQLEETGPQIERLWNGILVQYNDVDGSTRVVGPTGSGADTEDAGLLDDDTENPATKLGIRRWDVLQMGTSTAAGAIEVGRRFLEETKTLDRSGRARIVGSVEDDSGVRYPYWKIRAGDQISFVDASDSSYRRIVRTDKTVSDRSCSVELDAPPEGLQQVLERLGVVLVPLGLT